jgi:hypothetical protein
MGNEKIAAQVVVKPNNEAVKKIPNYARFLMGGLSGQVEVFIFKDNVQFCCDISAVMFYRRIYECLYINITSLTMGVFCFTPWIFDMNIYLNIDDLMHQKP